MQSSCVNLVVAIYFLLTILIVIEPSLSYVATVTRTQIQEQGEVGRKLANFIAIH